MTPIDTVPAATEEAEPVKLTAEQEAALKLPRTDFTTVLAERVRGLRARAGALLIEQEEIAAELDELTNGGVSQARASSRVDVARARVTR